MTNGEKYKTIGERLEKFRNWCDRRSCDNCVLRCLEDEGTEGCVFGWLELECKEGLKPCPFCRSNRIEIETIHEDKDDLYYIRCKNCEVNSGKFYRKENAVNAWNRRYDNGND
jgi:Lar family restriction alleviation protein